MFSPATRRRACATTFLGFYVLATIGFPIELPVAIDSSTPFPCQHHRCGCQSAEQCWRKCCCFSHEEKLAWAKAHRVAVPEHLIAANDASADDHAAHGHEAHGHEAHDHEAHDHEAHSHDAHSQATHSCHDDEQARTADCGQSNCASGKCAAGSRELATSPATHRATGGGCGSCSADKSGSKESSSVLAFQALKCRGVATYWCSVGAVLPPPPILNWQFDWTCRGQVVCNHPRLPLLGDAPPVPPPRA